MGFQFNTCAQYWIKQLYWASILSIVFTQIYSISMTYTRPKKKLCTRKYLYIEPLLHNSISMRTCTTIRVLVFTTFLHALDISQYESLRKIKLCCADHS